MSESCYRKNPFLQISNNILRQRRKCLALFGQQLDGVLWGTRRCVTTRVWSTVLLVTEIYILWQLICCTSKVDKLSFIYISYIFITLKVSRIASVTVIKLSQLYLVLI